MSLNNMTLDEVKFWSKVAEIFCCESRRTGFNRCPECKHLMPCEAKDYNICPVCMVEFGAYVEEHETTEIVWSPTSSSPAPQKETLK